MLFKILLGAERFQTKFVSPGIIMLHYPLVWAERCLWDLHLLQNFIWEKGARLLTATRSETQEKCNFAFCAKPREDFPPRGRGWGETTTFPKVFRMHKPCELEVKHGDALVPPWCAYFCVSSPDPDLQPPETASILTKRRRKEENEPNSGSFCSLFL